MSIHKYCLQAIVLALSGNYIYFYTANNIKQNESHTTKN